LKCGKTLPFQSKVPFSADKVEDGWNLLTDERNGQIISVRGSEIASIASQDVDKIAPDKKDDREVKAAQIGKKKAQAGKKTGFAVNK
jgi:hypothetical protein